MRSAAVSKIREKELEAQYHFIYLFIFACSSINILRKPVPTQNDIFSMWQHPGLKVFHCRACFSAVHTHEDSDILTDSLQTSDFLCVRWKVYNMGCVLVHFAVIKYLAGLILAHGLERVQPIMVGKARWQDLLLPVVVGF